MSTSNYKHKSGAQKRKIQTERQLKEFTGRQPITKFFRTGKEENVAYTPGHSFSENTVASTGTKPSLSSTLSISEDAQSADNSESTASYIVLNQKVEDGGPTLVDNPVIVEEPEVDQIDKSDNIKNDDPGTWPTAITDNLRQNIVSSHVSFITLQSLSKTFPKDLKGKQFQEFLLYTKTADKRARQQFPREWLAWSPIKETLHCLPCRLFHEKSSRGLSNASRLARNGFSPKQRPWRRLYDMLPSHENSSEHRKNYLAWKSFQMSLHGSGIDKNLQQQIQCEATKWRAVLQRILDTTLFLSCRGLAFQGENTTVGDVHNGNFLGILELLGKYDDVMREHLAKVQQQQLEGKSMKGQAHYLSWYSQNEFISLCGEKLLKTILHQREEAIYFGLIVDATPDISHKEQNVLIIRYVYQNQETNEYEVCERFVKFMNFTCKTGEAITEEILLSLKSHNIPLEDCRSQGYDNGANMRGEINGVKTRILERNETALFSPCGAHSLNRIGVNAAKMNSDVIKFFGNIESFYSFFSHSPARWEVLKKHVPLSLQSLSETRWSERIQAVRPIVKHYPGVLKVLDVILEEMATSLTPSSHNTIKGLKKYFGSFKGLLMSSFWHKILSSIDQKNIVIQSKGISLNVEIGLVRDLLNEMQQLRDSWENILKEAKLVAEAVGLDSDFPKQKSRCRKRDDSSSTNTEASEPHKEFKTTVVYSVLDFIMSDLRTRFEAADFICEVFSPILNFTNMENEELTVKAKSLVSKFKKDLSEDLVEEILHMKSIHSTVFETENNPLKLLNSIYKKNLQGIFVNFCLAIRLFCTVPVTVSSAERSFSILANSLKTWQRSTTSQDRLNHLAILAIENDLAKKVDFSDVIDQFSQRKARKMFSST